MRKLVLGTYLAGMVLAGSGCIFTSDDDDDGISDDGDDLGDDGGDDGGIARCGESFVGILYEPTWVCPPDAESITFTAFPDGETVSLTPDNFDCGEVQPPAICYDPGIYDIEILPEGGIGDFAPQFDSLDGVDGDLFDGDYVFSDVGGFFALSWTIDGADPAKACEPGETISVTATLAGSKDKPFIDEDIPCEDGGATIPPGLDGWPVGTYTLDIALIDAKDVAISVPEPFEEDIAFEGELFDLGTIDLLPK